MMHGPMNIKKKIIIWCIRIVCWITKAIDILRNTYFCSAATVVTQTRLKCYMYTYIACLV